MNHICVAVFAGGGNLEFSKSVEFIHLYFKGEAKDHKETRGLEGFSWTFSDRKKLFWYESGFRESRPNFRRAKHSRPKTPFPKLLPNAMKLSRSVFSATPRGALKPPEEKRHYWFQNNWWEDQVVYPGVASWVRTI